MKKLYLFYAALSFYVPDLNILSNTHLDKILTGFIWKFLFLNPLFNTLDLSIVQEFSAALGCAENVLSKPMAESRRQVSREQKRINI